MMIVSMFIRKESPVNTPLICCCNTNHKRDLQADYQQNVHIIYSIHTTYLTTMQTVVLGLWYRILWLKSTIVVIIVYCCFFYKRERGKLKSNRTKMCTCGFGMERDSVESKSKKWKWHGNYTVENRQCVVFSFFSLTHSNSNSPSLYRTLFIVCCYVYGVHLVLLLFIFDLLFWN